MISRVFSSSLSVVLVVIGLEALTRLASIPTYLLPAPSLIIRDLVENFPSIIYNLENTMSAAVIGFLVGNIAALVIAIIFSQFRLLREAFLPFLIFLQAMPLVALAPYVVIWFGPGMIGETFMTALICYFPAAVYLVSALSKLDPEGIRLLASLGASKSQIFRHFTLPASIPAVAASLEVTATLSVIGAIVAELSGSSRGIGYLILSASYRFDAPLFFAALLVAGIASCGLYYVARLIGRRTTKRFRVIYVD